MKKNFKKKKFNKEIFISFTGPHSWTYKGMELTWDDKEGMVPNYYGRRVIEFSPFTPKSLMRVLQHRPLIFRKTKDRAKFYFDFSYADTSQLACDRPWLLAGYIPAPEEDQIIRVPIQRVLFDPILEYKLVEGVLRLERSIDITNNPIVIGLIE